MIINPDKVTWVRWKWATCGPNEKEYLASMVGAEEEVGIDEVTYDILSKYFKGKLADLSELNTRKAAR